MTEPETYHFPENSGIPNNAELPVLLYRGVFAENGRSSADELENCFKKQGWRGTWRWSVYDFHHYHSTAHEVLGVAEGEAELMIGGPDGEILSVRRGDVVILPAGTGHKKVSADEGFQVVGAYPAGQENYDLIKIDEPLTEKIRKNIRATPRPDSDPVYGPDGPLPKQWRA